MAFLKLIIEIDRNDARESVPSLCSKHFHIGTVSAIPQIIFVSDHVGHFQVHIAKLL